MSAISTKINIGQQEIGVAAITLNVHIERDSVGTFCLVFVGFGVFIDVVVDCRETANFD